MATENTITITNPEIVEFFTKNDLFTCESFLLHHIKQYSNPSTKKIEISTDELHQLYQMYQTIMCCKNNFEKINKAYCKDFKSVNYLIKLKPLENLFEQHLNIKQELFVCEYCAFSCSTKKGIVTHKRKCDTTKISDNEEPDDEDETDT